MLPSNPRASTKADGLVIPSFQSARLFVTDARLKRGSSPFLRLRLWMAESGGLPRVSAGHRFRHLPEGSRGEPLVSFPPTFRNRKVGPPEAGHRTADTQKSASDNPPEYQISSFSLQKAPISALQTAQPNRSPSPTFHQICPKSRPKNTKSSGIDFSYQPLYNRNDK